VLRTCWLKMPPVLQGGLTKRCQRGVWVLERVQLNIQWMRCPFCARCILMLEEGAWGVELLVDELLLGLGGGPGCLLCCTCLSPPSCLVPAQLVWCAPLLLLLLQVGMWVCQHSKPTLPLRVLVTHSTRTFPHPSSRLSFPSRVLHLPPTSVVWKWKQLEGGESQGECSPFRGCASKPHLPGLCSPTLWGCRLLVLWKQGALQVTWRGRMLGLLWRAGEALG
jgi:hypothetical protein